MGCLWQPKGRGLAPCLAQAAREWIVIVAPSGARLRTVKEATERRDEESLFSLGEGLEALECLRARCYRQPAQLVGWTVECLASAGGAWDTDLIGNGWHSGLVVGHDASRRAHRIRLDASGEGAGQKWRPPSLKTARRMRLTLRRQLGARPP